MKKEKKKKKKKNASSLYIELTIHRFLGLEDFWGGEHRRIASALGIGGYVEGGGGLGSVGCKV